MSVIQSILQPEDDMMAVMNEYATGAEWTAAMEPPPTTQKRKREEADTIIPILRMLHSQSRTAAADRVEIAALVEEEARLAWRNEFFVKYGIEVQPEVRQFPMASRLTVACRCRMHRILT